MDAEFAEHGFKPVLAGALGVEPVTIHQEGPGPVDDVPVDGAIRQGTAAIAEIALPAAQEAVDPVPHGRPWRCVAARQHVAHLALNPRQALRGRASAEIAASGQSVAMRSEAIAEEVEALGAGCLERGLG